MKIKDIFLILFFSILCVLNILAGIYLARFNSIDDFLYFFIIQIINIGVAYRFTEFFLSIIVAKKDLPKVDILKDYPPVALLYVTYNDASQVLISRLRSQNYKNYNIYILDDSTNDKCIRIINNSGLEIIRRKTRKGFKAGSLNNWLSLFGGKYKYFIISDSDSCFEIDFLKKMVSYAEHPQNENVAIFQSKILPWNTKRSFPKIAGTMIPLSMYISEKLGNECALIVSWGHNNLHRTKMIMDIGRFNERFISEDYATGLALLKRGYECKIVDVISYDSMPETIQSYTKRSLRWAKQTLQLIKFDTSNIQFNTQLHLFMAIYNNLIYTIFSIGMLYTIFSSSSSLIDSVRIIKLVVSGEIFQTNCVTFVLLLFYILNFSFLRLPLASTLGISATDYCKSLLLDVAIGCYMMIPLFREELKTILGEDLNFEVTEKNRNPRKISFFQLIRDMKIVILFNLALVFGLSQNPAFLIFNFIWLIPWLFSPIVIYLIQNAKVSNK